MIHTLDATNKTLGRLASAIAVLLRGKDSPSFKPYLMPSIKVKIINAGKIRFTGKKFDQKVYYRYSGYPGGIRARKLSEAFTRDPARVLRAAVLNMLPKNRQRSRIIGNLEIQK